LSARMEMKTTLSTPRTISMARSVAKATHDSGSAVQSNQLREVAASIGEDATSVVMGERASVKRIVLRSAIGS
jgi:hypothetical protein